MNLSFNHLSDAQLSELSNAWLFDADLRAAIERYALLKAMLPELQEAHDALIGLDAPGAKEARYKGELLDADVAHDRASRGALEVLTGVLTLTGDAKLGALITFLYPTGAAINAKTYMDEAGEGTRINAKLSAEQKKLLGAIQLHDKSSLLDHVNARIAQARRMGDLLDARANEGASAAPVVQEETRRGVRSRWMVVARAMLQNMGVAKVSADDARLLTAKLTTVQP
jgi:hypothetical protein